MIIFLARCKACHRRCTRRPRSTGPVSWRKFFYITLPLISPTMFFNACWTIIGSLSVFSLAYIATNGGRISPPTFTSTTSSRRVRVLEMGYAAALAWLFFLIVLVLTLIQFRLSDRWVFYAGGDSREEVRDAQ